MKDQLVPGIVSKRKFKVDRDSTISFMGEELRIYGTPFMVRDIEQTCRDLLLQYIPEGEDSVGTRVEIDHMAPTLMNMDVEITVSIAEVKGRAITFEVVAHDLVEQICKGHHSRFIASIEKTKARLKDKSEKV